MTRVLIAEDDKMTRIILRQQLKKWNYEIIEAENGQEALDILSGDNPPAITLMDWIMPVMSGIEVCHRLKEKDGKIVTYVIMLTSKDESADIVEALEAGADDFMSKPVNSAVLRSRINVAIRTTDYRKQLEKYAHQMEELAENRAQQLVHADRLVTIGTMASGIVHEINNPLSVISSSAQIFEKYWPNIEPLIVGAITENSSNAKILTILHKEFPELIQSLRNNTERINQIISNLKRFFRKDSADGVKDYPISECIKNSLSICHAKVKNTVKIELDLSEEALTIKAMPHQIDQVIVNIIVNATEALTSRNSNSQGTIKIKTCRVENNVQIIIDNDGPEIPEEMIKNIWESFYTTKKTGTGLGLSISLDIIKSHNGTMIVENLADNAGVRFTVTLPLIDI